MNVFVYGTLRQGQSNHRVMERSHGRLIATTSTKETFAMTCNGHFPYALKNGHQTKIIGEVYEVDTLYYLDALEGVDSGHYYREKVKLENGSTAWMYFVDNETSALQCPFVECGDWVLHVDNCSCRSAPCTRA